MSHKLLAFDTDHIKDYVFATGVLRDIRGASALLDGLNRHDMQRLVAEVDPNAMTAYAHGGSGLFVVDSSRAEAARLAVQRRYAEATESASISAAAIELPGEVVPGRDFHHTWRQLAHRLRAEKDRNPVVAELTSHALLRPCEACGVRYSTIRWPGPEGEQRICGSCQRKREQDDRIRGEDIPRGLGQPELVAGDADPLWQRLIVNLRRSGYPLARGLGRPEDFDTLATASRPDGYLGLIYADGDGIGRQLEQLRTLEEIGHFARVVDHATSQALVQAIIRNLRPAVDSPIFPFDVLLLGGDDIVLVTAADRAIEAALTLVEEFSRETDEQLQQPLRLSASVVIAHARYPFAALLKLAEGGLGFAKRAAAARRRHGQSLKEGLVNFLVLSSANHLDFDTFVERELQSRSPLPWKALDRTLRPYTPTDLRRLLTGARVLAGAPRTRLQHLREACYGNLAEGHLAGLEVLLRWPESESKQEAQQLVSDFASSATGGKVQFPWFLDEARKVWRTPLADAVEILDFVAPEEDHATAP